jgi:hypothetical protein
VRCSFIHGVLKRNIFAILSSSGCVKDKREYEEMNEMSQKVCVLMK